MIAWCLVLCVAVVAAMCLRAGNEETLPDVPEYAGGATSPAPMPADLSHNPHLFIDDYLIASVTDLDCVTHRPVRHEGNPILTPEQFTHQPYLTVLRDEKAGRFRMWYNAHRDGGHFLAYADSDDGLRWVPPDLQPSAVLPNAVFDQNSYTRDGALGHAGYGGSVIDDGPGAADASRRYKHIWFGKAGCGSEGESGLNVAFSADGLHWAAYEGNPVLHFDQPGWRPGDIVDAFWDPVRRRYGLFNKVMATRDDGLAPGPRVGDGFRRLAVATVSEDFIHWALPRRVLVPGPWDRGLTEFYAVGGTIARGGLLIGFVRMLIDDARANPPDGPADGIGWAALVTSRDGVHWQRHQDVFLDRGDEPDDWDRAVSWISSAVTVDERMYFYYAGYKQGHKLGRHTERQIGVAFLPRDRFVGWRATGAGVGLLQTVTLDLAAACGGQLRVNADASAGALRCRVLDGDRRVIPGYDWADCDGVTGAGLTLPVTWGGRDLSGTRRQYIRLEFELTAAELFGFEIA